MNNATLVAMARMACGTAILITHMITGANSTFVILGVVLLGVPVEALAGVTKEEIKET